MVPGLILLTNAVLTVLVLALVWRMYRAADIYNKNQGDGVVQAKQKWKILWSLLWLLIIGFIAAVLNLASTFLDNA